jgi:hypothetical protein
MKLKLKTAKTCKKDRDIVSFLYAENNHTGIFDFMLNNNDIQ